MDASLRRSAEELADCWDDDERMDFLFSDFPPDPAVNPEHWRNKMDFWRRLIVDLCCHCSRVCVTYELVRSWVCRKGKSPLGLKLVWEDMVADRSLIVTSEFIGDIARNASWVGWGLNTFVRKPTMWAAGKVLSPLKTLSPIKSANVNKVPHVCMKAFALRCESLLGKMQSLHSRVHGNLHIISLADLAGLTRDVVDNEKDLEFLLLSLEKDKKVSIFEKSSPERCAVEKLVKFAAPSHPTVAPVSEYDLGVLKLEDARKALQQQISSLSQEQSRLVDAARGHLRSGERAAAKSALRQKQRAATTLKNKEASLDNINQLLERLEQCKSDKMVVEAFRVGVATYNQAVKENGLDIDIVDATMDDVNAMLADHDEISSTLASPVGDHSESNEALENELAEMLQENDDNVVSNPTDDGILSSQTDADIAKLVSGLSVAPSRPQNNATKKKARAPMPS